MAGHPPFVHEKGPYSYRESKEKVNITWEGDNVNYNQVTFYKLDLDNNIKSIKELDSFYNALFKSPKY